jgi:hypothetical protein
LHAALNTSASYHLSVQEAEELQCGLSLLLRHCENLHTVYFAELQCCICEGDRDDVGMGEEDFVCADVIDWSDVSKARALLPPPCVAAPPPSQKQVRRLIVSQKKKVLLVKSQLEEDVRQAKALRCDLRRVAKASSKLYRPTYTYRGGRWVPSAMLPTAAWWARWLKSGSEVVYCSSDFKANELD